MSRHEGVSCDSCLIGNFRGKRYKCLICYDYDLCATCFEAGATTTRHTIEHPMQCILTRSDFDLYYGGEAISVEQPQSFTCPFCSKMGFTESSLQEHVSSEHSDMSSEVVCPVCAALPGGDPNLVTDDFAAHLTLEHRSPRDLISFADEPSSSRHVRRIPHPGRGVGATRARRTNMHFSSSGGLASLSPSSRESMDPIAELLSQLSGVRRSGAASQSSSSSQLQQLQMQLQLERQQAQVARQQQERLPRRQAQIVGGAVGSGSQMTTAGTAAAMTLQPAVVVEPSAARTSSSSSQFLLARYAESQFSETELQQGETDRADRSIFVRELLTNALVEGLSIDLSNTCTMKSPPSCEEGGPSRLPPPRDAESPANSTPPPQVQASVTRVTAAKKSTGSVPNSRISSRNGNALIREQPTVTGNVRSASSAQTQPQQQRVVPSGTGTMREMPAVPQGMVQGRLPVRSGTSPSSSTRRKMVRHLDGRNQSNEPPPPH